MRERATPRKRHLSVGLQLRRATSPCAASLPFNATSTSPLVRRWAVNAQPGLLTLRQMHRSAPHPLPRKSRLGNGQSRKTGCL
mmetsp:Transcript_41569/g.91368  ORF Transcript_41569/g.91368 Transcript_41569/m.91368 type:complete len:83 (-) Transcript_41569:81-329(-)